MSYKSDSEKLAPLCNPAYWQGLQPGVDIAPSVPAPPRYGRMTPKPGDALTNYVEKMHTYFSHHAYIPGDEFDANHQPDGTIITYFQESLTATPGCAEALRQEFPEAMQQAPQLPFDELEPVSRYTHRLRAKGGQYIYAQRWGVVATHKKTQAKTVLTLPAHDISFDYKKVYAGADLTPLATQFIIGNTFSYQEGPNTPHDPETFVRVKRLHIAGYQEEGINNGPGELIRTLASLLLPKPGGSPAANPSKA